MEARIVLEDKSQVSIGKEFLMVDRGDVEKQDAFIF